jgi:hypothetical protein
MDMKRLITAIVVAGGAVLIPASVASAGEYNPARGYIFSPPNETAGSHSQVLIYPNDDTSLSPAASICSFNGRDDTDTDDNELWAASPAGGRVQSVGQFTVVMGFPPLQGTGCAPGGGEE